MIKSKSLLKYIAFSGYLTGSFFVTAARGLGLTYIVLILHQFIDLSLSEIGFVVSGAVFVGGFMCVFFGNLIDRLNAKIILNGMCIFSIISYLLIYNTQNIWLIFLLLTVLVLGYSTISVTINSAVAKSTSSKISTKVFSFRYSLTNLAFGIFPLLGAMLLKRNDGAVFWLAAIAMIMALVAFSLQKSRTKKSNNKQVNEYSHSLKLLLMDKKLFYYAVAGFLTSIALRQFPSYISLFLLSSGMEDISKIISTLIIINTGMVVIFQVHVTNLFDGLTLITRSVFGLLLLTLGLVGFMYASSLPFWCLSMVAFSLAEMIIVPTEYSLIKNIALPSREGAYFAIHNLSSLGGSFSPLICGLMLSYLPMINMFFALIACVIVAIFGYLIGNNARGATVQTVTQKVRSSQ